MQSTAVSHRQARQTLERVAGFTRRRDAFADVIQLTESIFDPKTPTWKLGLKKVEDGFLRSPAYPVVQAATDRGTGFKVYMQLLGSLLEVLGHRGYRSLKDIVTWQEHYLMGSSSGRRFHEHPPAYTPLGMLASPPALTMEEARVARRLEPFFLASRELFVLDDAVHAHLLVSPIHVYVSFEDLTPDGKTVRDPQPVIAQDGVWERVSGIPRIPNFPFGREG